MSEKENFYFTENFEKLAAAAEKERDRLYKETNVEDSNRETTRSEETSIETLLKKAYLYLKELEFDGSYEASKARQAIGYAVSFLNEGQIYRAEKFLQKGLAYACEALNLSAKRFEVSFELGEGEKLYVSLQKDRILTGIFGEGGNSTCEERPAFLLELLSSARLVNVEVFKEDREPSISWLYQEFFKETYQGENYTVTLFARYHGHGDEEYAEIKFSSPEEARNFFEYIKRSLKKKITPS